LGLNSAGQIVGYSVPSGPYASRAFLYDAGTMTDLNSLLPEGSGWSLLQATGINDAGQIVGSGSNPSGQFRGFLLSPTGDGGAGGQGMASGFEEPAILPPLVALVSRSDTGSSAGQTPFFGDRQAAPLPPPPAPVIWSELPPRVSWHLVPLSVS